MPILCILKHIGRGHDALVNRAAAAAECPDAAQIGWVRHTLLMRAHEYMNET